MVGLPGSFKLYWGIFSLLSTFIFPILPHVFLITELDFVFPFFFLSIDTISTSGNYSFFLYRDNSFLLSIFEIKH